ncbi:MAG: hypothetical protein COA79_12080 [Planctomycetota bacterium]|nr:MAG: hypothetical protein COA79_12080 [Planctomycetota bacterium]
MKKIAGFITRHFSLVLILCLCIGLIFQEFSMLISPYIKYPLIGVMFLGFLNIDLSILKKEIKRIDLQIGLLVFANIVLPIILYTVTLQSMRLFNLNPHWAYGALILYASPTGALCPALCILLNGNPERATINLILTTVTVPFSLPFLVNLFIPISANFKLDNLVADLLIIVFIPLVMAVFAKLFFRKFTTSIVPHLAPISILLIGAVVIGAVSGLTIVILENPIIAIKGTIISSILISAAFILGWFFAIGGTNKDRMTLSIFSSWPNVGLTIVIASDYFKKEFMIAWIFVVLSEITWNTAFIPAQKWSTYLKNKSLEKTDGE